MYLLLGINYFIAVNASTVIRLMIVVMKRAGTAFEIAIMAVKSIAYRRMLNGASYRLYFFGITVYVVS